MSFDRNLPPLHDTEKILSGLKDFQRGTVEHVFRRMYLDPDCTRRFLVADEVGLGKTLIARGVIAKAIDHLWDKTDRIDIVYICSNGDIARQNINRLNITGRRDFALASRITLLPITMPEIGQSRINFISFTPGTSFEMANSTGQSSERVLLYHLLDRHWSLSPIRAKASVLLQGGSGIYRFREQLDAFDTGLINDRVANCFFRHLDHDTSGLRTRFKELCERLPRAGATISTELRAERNQMVGDLRRRLAQACLDWLKPDLIILDEFQRFKQLLTGDDEAAQLASQLFDHQTTQADPSTGTRVLLLSATPYKMYTLSHEATDDDHYADFRGTLEFLNRDAAWRSALHAELGSFRRELLAIGEHGPDRLRDAKRLLESRLRQVMVRTERLAVSADRNGMLAVIPDAGKLANDVEHYLTLRRVAQAVDHDDVLEYWKSSPYLLSFMENYQLKLRFHDAVEQPDQDPELISAVSAGAGGLLRRREIERYQSLDPSNARLRTLFTDLLDRGAWRLLWVPPSRPYYRGEGPFADPRLEHFTKRLLFSSWQVVPKTVAALVSYEAERRMVQSYRSKARNTEQARKKRRALLRFHVKDDRPSAMPSLTLFYPSRELAERFDPLRMGSEPLRNGQAASLAVVLETARQRIEKRLEPLAELQTATERPEDERWYWAAPLLFDLERDRKQGVTETLDWFAQSTLAQDWAGGEDVHRDVGRAWKRHVDEARRMVRGDGDSQKLGRFPHDLARVLALVAVASPANCAYRALVRSAGGTEPFQLLRLRNFAGATAFAFRHLFNLPEVMCLLRDAQQETPYWQSVLNYCANGNLQAVLDEFVHLLVESEELRVMPPDEAAQQLCIKMRHSLALRTSTVQSDVIRVRGGRVTFDKPLRLRTRFAMRFGDQDSEDSATPTRADDVRAAFNSPFWPFVLTTTSIGQEGLDFHLYCHAVTHWNLPSNPVDLEQREGRVHRYKGHALRKNLAAAWTPTAGEAGVDRKDPWNAMFAAAREDSQRRGENDLQPFWILPGGEHKIERHIPALPLSREGSHRDQLLRSLVLYRLVFGQNRQDDLVDYLSRHLTAEQVDAMLRDCRIDLSPQNVP